MVSNFRRETKQKVSGSCPALYSNNQANVYESGKREEVLKGI